MICDFFIPLRHCLSIRKRLSCSTGIDWRLSLSWLTFSEIVDFVRILFALFLFVLFFSIINLELYILTKVSQVNIHSSSDWFIHLIEFMELRIGINNRIQQLAPLDITIIHKTIEHVLLTTGNRTRTYSLQPLRWWAAA